MPRRELRHPKQVEEWLQELGAQMSQPGEMILIGSGGLLWHFSFLSASGTSHATACMRVGRGRTICYNSAVSARESLEKVWGPYPNYDDIARFQYGRRFWKLPDMRARLLRH